MLHVAPPSVLNCRLPPVPLTVPRVIVPPLSVQFVQVLLVMASAPDGAAGVAFTVIVTLLLLVLQITPLVVVYILRNV